MEKLLKQPSMNSQSQSPAIYSLSLYFNRIGQGINIHLKFLSNTSDLIHLFTKTKYDHEKKSLNHALCILIDNLDIAESKNKKKVDEYLQY